MFERYEIDWDAYHQRAQTGPCFVCGIIARDPAFPAHRVCENETAVVFLDKYPRVYGYTLVAPRDHRVHVAGDFTMDEYLALQRTVYRVAEAVRQEVNAKRVYLLSLGSNQGNAHVHWHIVPLPPGVPSREQQLGINKKGILKIPEEEMAAFAARLAKRMEIIWETYAKAQPLDPLYQRRRPIYQLLWCLEYARPTAQHLADTQRVCAELGLASIEHF